MMATRAYCAGKVKFTTYAFADGARDRGGRGRVVYHCQHCNAYHLAGRTLGREGAAIKLKRHKIKEGASE